MTSTSDSDAKKHSRLHPVEELKLEPWLRAPSITDCSVYWLPVHSFPMLPQQREWIGEFHLRLAALMKSDRGLREETFLQFKSLYPDLIERFTDTSSQFMPVTGMSLRPGEQPTPLPDLDAIRTQVESAQKNGTGIDTTSWMPDYLQWFVRKRPVDQRVNFLGYGGLLTLYIEPDPATVAPVLDLPGFVKSLPVYDPNMQSDIDAAYSLRDAFLAKSKATFGKPFMKDPAYRGMAFILPLLSSQSILNATPEQREEWFGVFDGYFLESKQDRGMVLVLKDSEFDQTLNELLQKMAEDGLVYRN
jgi:hypothetical protein